MSTRNPTTSDATLDKTYDELYELAQEKDVSGRSTMNKGELLDALTDGPTNVQWDDLEVAVTRIGPQAVDFDSLTQAITETTGPKQIDWDDLTPAIRRIGAFTDVEIIEEGDTVEFSNLAYPITVTGVNDMEDSRHIVAQTSRGGTHKMIIYNDDDVPNVLRRRRGKKDAFRWMANSDKPEYIKLIRRGE